LSITRVAVQVVSEPEIYQGTGFKLHIDARFDSRSFLWPPKRSEGGSEGWCPGARTTTNLSWVQEQKQKP
jgi:hypothetical protein